MHGGHGDTCLGRMKQIDLCEFKASWYTQRIIRQPGLFRGTLTQKIFLNVALSWNLNTWETEAGGRYLLGPHSEVQVRKEVLVDSLSKDSENFSIA